MRMTAPGEVYNAQALEKGWDARCDAPGAFAWAGFTPLLALWEELRGPGALPRRDAMTARRLKQFLSDIALYERIAEGASHVWRLRLAGTQFAQIYGENTGRLLRDWLAPDAAFRFQLGLDEVLAAGVPLRFRARTDCGDKKFMSGEFCALPLADSEGRPAMVMLCAHFSATPWPEFLAATGSDTAGARLAVLRAS
jgi:hypothetical protein